MITPEQLAQLKQAVETLAPVLGRYHASLVEANFTREEALSIVIAWQSAICAAAASSRASATSTDA